MSTKGDMRRMPFRLDKQNLSSQVLEFIKENLLFSGLLENGQKITEHEISRVLGVSRSPVREAFKQLQEEGLITLKPKKGAFASIISQEDIQEIYQIRFWIESNLYDVIIKNNLLSEVEYESLKSDADALVKIVESDMSFEKKMTTFSRNSIGFHMGLCALADMKLAMKIVSMLCNRMRIAMVRDLKYAKEFKKNAFLHYKILDALKDNDLNAAKGYLREDFALYSII